MPESKPSVIKAASLPADSPGEDRLRERVKSLHIESAREKSRFGWFPWLLCLVLIGANGWSWFWFVQHKNAASEGDAANTGSASGASTTSTSTSGDGGADAATPAERVSPGQIVLESKGYIVPRRKILVSPKVNGMVVKLNVDEGMKVKQGDILAIVENTEYEADFNQSKAAAELLQQRLLELETGSRPEEIAQSRAELAEAEAQLPEMQANYERNKSLIKTGATTSRSMEQSESLFRAQQRKIDRLKEATKLVETGPRVERINAARAEWAEAKATMAKSKWKLDNCTIRAPISGTILTKNAEEGNIVNPIAFNGSYSLCEMADLSDMEVDLAIQERDVSHVFAGQRCRLRAEAFPERIYKGVVSRLMPIADRAKGAVPVRVKIDIPADESGVYLKPEMGAIVSFLAKETAATASTDGTNKGAAKSVPESQLPPTPKPE